MVLVVRPKSGVSQLASFVGLAFPEDRWLCPDTRSWLDLGLGIAWFASGRRQKVLPSYSLRCVCVCAVGLGAASRLFLHHVALARKKFQMPQYLLLGSWPISSVAFHFRIAGWANQFMNGAFVISLVLVPFRAFFVEI